MWEQEFASDGASARARRRCSHFFVFRKFSRRGIKSRGPHLPEVTPCVTTKLRTTLQSTHLGLLLTPHCSPGLPTYCKPSASFLKPRMQRPLETCHNPLAGLGNRFHPNCKRNLPDAKVHHKAPLARVPLLFRKPSIHSARLEPVAA